MISLMVNCIVIVVFLALFGPLIKNLIKLSFFLLSVLWPVVLTVVYGAAMIGLWSIDINPTYMLLTAVIYTTIFFVILFSLVNLQIKSRSV